MEENPEGNEDPALKTLSQVFKSLFSSTSSSSTSDSNIPKTSQAAANSESQMNFPQEIMTFFQSFNANLANQQQNDSGAISLNKQNAECVESGKEMSPMKLFKLLEPLINENLVKEIQTVYEFHIKIVNSSDRYSEERVETFHLDLKNSPKGLIGRGASLFSKPDCTIKLNDQDLKELLSDNLKPFTAYMSGRIEIDGDLQDVFKLKKLINSVVINSKKLNS
jgi:hypothetical protein